MRSERREEEKRQRAVARGNRFFRILAVLYTLILAAFIGLLIWLNVLPPKYLYAIIAILILVSVFIVPVMFSRYGVRKRKIAAAFLQWFSLQDSVSDPGTWRIRSILSETSLWQAV